MTLIVGIIAKDAIVMASDSRTSFDGQTIQDNAKKIRILKYKGGEALIGASGFTGLAYDAIDQIQERIYGKEMPDARSLPVIIKGVIRDILTEQVKPFTNVATMSHHQLIERLKCDQGFSLMLGFFHSGTPFLYTFDFPQFTIEPGQQHFSSVGLGNGGDLGAYLLEEFTTFDMGLELASAFSVYVVESVGCYNKSVGGPTRVAVLLGEESQIKDDKAYGFIADQKPYLDFRIVRAYFLPQHGVESLSKIVSAVRGATRERHIREVKDELSLKASREWETMRAKLTSATI